MVKWVCQRVWSLTVRMPQGGDLCFLTHSLLYCLAIRKKKVSYTRKVGERKSTSHSQARKPALRPGFSWPTGEFITSLTVGCHLNAAMGPAIIPFTVLDSGMVRSYRGKGRSSKHRGTSGAGVFLPNSGSTSSLFCSL